MRTPIRSLLAVMLALSLAACGGKKADIPAGDQSLGPETAKVTVVEYASVGCPICARWNQEVWPAFKQKYVDTGKVRYTLREMLVGQGMEVSYGASGFLLARCAGKDKYFPVVDAVFHAQSDVYSGAVDPRSALYKIAQQVGMSETDFNTCINDDKAILALNQRSEDHATKDNINATPTFVINGKALEPGYHPLGDLDAAIAQAGG
jgi:protein-disulfide isomerase